MARTNGCHPAALAIFAVMIVGGPALFPACSERSNESSTIKLPPGFVPDASSGAEDAPVCGLGEAGAACTSPITGCPSVEQCRHDRTRFVCPCDTCDLELGSGECAWNVTAPNLAPVTFVNVVAPDGGSSGLPRLESELGCREAPGWYTEEPAANALRIVLCPASCDDHANDPSVRFVIRRLCPPD